MTIGVCRLQATQEITHQDINVNVHNIFNILIHVAAEIFALWHDASFSNHRVGQYLISSIPSVIRSWLRSQVYCAQSIRPRFPSTAISSKQVSGYNYFTTETEVILKAFITLAYICKSYRKRRYFTIIWVNRKIFSCG